MIRFIIPYFGEWPVWMPFFLESCKSQEGYEWLLLGDNELTIESPRNVTFLKMGLDDVHQRIIDCGLPSPEVLIPYKLCDYKPAYGMIFSDLLEGANFWGHTDIDLAYGCLSNLANEEFLKDIDVFSADDRSCGHFQIFRNEERMNRLFLNVPNIDSCLSLTYYVGIDESGMSIALHQEDNLRWRRASSRKVELTKKQPWMGATIEPGGQIIDQKIDSVESYLWNDGHAFQILANGERREFLYLHWFQWKNHTEKWESLMGSKEWKDKNVHFTLKEWAIHRSKTKILIKTFIYKAVYRSLYWLSPLQKSIFHNLKVFDKARAIAQRNLLIKKESEASTINR